MPADDVVQEPLVARLEGTDQLVGHRRIAPAAILGRLGLHPKVTVVVVLGKGPDVPAHLGELGEGNLPDGFVALRIVQPGDHALDRVQLAAAVVDDVFQLGLGLRIVADVHIGLGGIGQGAGFGEAADHPVRRPPVKVLGSVFEVFLDRLPGFFIRFRTSLLGRIGIGLTRHQHRHAAEIDSQVVVGGGPEAARFGLVDPAGLFGHDLVLHLLQVRQVEVGPGNHPIGVFPRILEEVGLGLDGPGMRAHLLVPAIGLQVERRHVRQRGMGFDIVVSGRIQVAVHTCQAHEDIVGILIDAIGIDDGVIIDLEEFVGTRDRQGGHARYNQKI